MTDSQEDEWEYEYDEAATEDLYINVDLSNIPESGDARAPAGAVRPSLTGHPILLQTRLRALDAVRRYEDAVVDSSSGEDQSSLGTMQISGLHTRQPLIMYNDQLLSCHWAAAIGTDLFFVKPDPNATDLSQPLRSLPSVDILATSAAKLMATVARLRPSEQLLKRVASTEEQAIAMSHTEPPATDNAAVGVSPVAPNSFLARLNEAKAKRGEVSRLAVKGTRLVVAAEESVARTEDSPAPSTS